MTLSLSKKNVLSVMTMTLTMISLISPADAQTACTSTSPDCCWVVESWEKMGKKTTVDRNSATACCSEIDGSPQISEMPVVKCSSSGIVTLINWKSKYLKGEIPEELGKLTSLWRLWLTGNQLTGSIPSSIGNLVNLKDLWLNGNLLTGSIPSELGNLGKLTQLYLDRNRLSGQIPSSLGFLTSVTLRLRENPGLHGTFTPKCGTYVIISNTKVIICGCLAASTPPTIFPPPETHADCLASNTLAKRTQVFSQAYNQEFGGRRYKCHVDSVTKNPFADCTNSMAFLCNTADSTWNSDPDKRQRCRKAVDDMYGQMNDLWQAVRRNCGQWSWTDGFTGSSSSDACATANKNLIEGTFYIQKDGTAIKVDSGFTNSQNDGLWSKVTA